MHEGMEIQQDVRTIWEGILLLTIVCWEMNIYSNTLEFAFKSIETVKFKNNF
jgi:hypothetical protein